MVACRMSDAFDNTDHHIPVLLNEAVIGLVSSQSGIYVDATFGRGSHAKAILDRLDRSGRLIALDKDSEAIAYAKQHLDDERFAIIHSSFAHLQSVLQEISVSGEVSGVLFDLGVSSPQLDNPERGFSFLRDGKLDMRMDTTRGLDAATWLAKVEEQELANVLWQYGEEKFSRRIARAIIAFREEKAITSTLQLADIIGRALPRSKHSFLKHPATRSFQAIRIAINQELTELQQGLAQAFDALRVGGRLCVISFHSLEDRVVKQFIKQHEKGGDLPRGLPVKGNPFKSRLKAVGKPIKPSLQEVNANPRARSAILRIAEKLS